MKALLFNHHPDYFWYTKTLLKGLGIESDCASEKLTFQMGADYSSISSDKKFRSGSKWYDPKELFPDLEFDVSDTLDGYDYYFTMNRNIAANLPFNNDRVIYSTVVIWDIMGCNDIKKYKKISSVDYIKNFGGTRITYFVPQKGILKEKKYITQLISGYKTIYFDKLLELKSKFPVVIAGDDKAPDGVVNDWEILSQTSLLVHHKEYGSCCNAVMKALDCGIPIYMSKENRYKLGFEDIPEYCFIFSDDYSIEHAYEISKTKDSDLIQKDFRKIKNCEKAVGEMKELLKL